MVREITIIKKPRKDALQDKPISFPPLQNLHLELMENKKKLKKNIPLVQVKKPVATSSGAPAVKVKPYSAEVMAGIAEPEPSLEKSSKPKKVSKSPAPEKTSKTKKIEKEPDAGADEGTDTGADVDAGADAGADDNLEDALADEVQEEEDDEVAADLAAATVEGVSAGIAAETSEKTIENMEGDDAEEPTQPQEDDPYAGLSPEEREAKEKEEYIWRFRILKKQYRSRDIPEFTEHDDLITMKTTYERTLREIGLETNLENYRMYLIGSFMAIEFASTHWMGINLDGFYSQQMLMMDKYDRLLIELGEKSYTRWGSNLPVEVRLLGFVILQAGLFYLGKIIADKAGSSVAELFKNITGQPVAKASNANTVNDEPEPAPKKKMRGPSIKVADLKKKVKRDTEES